MKLEFTFRDMEYSERLADHVAERLRKAKKFEFRPMAVRVTFRTVGREKQVEILVRGKNTRFQARAKGENFSDCIDKAVLRVLRQMGKKKEKVRRKSNRERSREGKLARLTPRLEEAEVFRSAS